MKDEDRDETKRSLSQSERAMPLPFSTKRKAETKSEHQKREEPQSPPKSRKLQPSVPPSAAAKTASKVPAKSSPTPVRKPPVPHRSFGAQRAVVNTTHPAPSRPVSTRPGAGVITGTQPQINAAPKAAKWEYFAPFDILTRQS